MTPTQGRPGILLVDDDSRLRDGLRTLLRRAGYGVLEAKDGREALKIFRASPVDLIVCDMFMPEKDGLETIRDLRAEFPGVKIIGISGGGYHGTMDVLHMAKLMGAAEVLSKPVAPEKLLAVIESVLARAG